MKYRIAIVDDHAQVISALADEINFSGEVDLVFTARNGAEYLEKLKHLPMEQHPQVVLMDIDMPVMNGIEAVRNGKCLYANIQYIMLTVFDNDDKLFDAIRAGADGYLLKEEGEDVILHAIAEVIEKEGAPMSPRIARKTLKLLTGAPAENTASEEQMRSALSEREFEILKGLVNGNDYKQIGINLSISPFTVRNHITKIYEKLHISSKGQAIKLALQNKWV